MSTRIIASDGMSEQGAVLFDSVSGWAFGPVFESTSDADWFLEWCRLMDFVDPRSMTEPELRSAIKDWFEARARNDADDAAE